ncbi:VOC family protein [Tatumella sp. UCD-D_suzukii]|uniref:VOC family protein n=1 Tax=Tatumella sp. UCD-D_suzukii TaxID=1408192 RepID=UPI0004727E97|nr:VOC family protein [Tatumella sp. UCD-D_suzukii]
MTLTTGVHHIGLTVSNPEESAEFFTRLLGWEVVKRLDDYPAIFVKDKQIMITLWKTQTEAPVNFNRKTNIGLHHLALKVNSREELLRVYARLKENNIEIEFEPTLCGEGPSMHMMCYEPGGIRIEFYCAE